jgi:mono/diheme cytochrome c family protein
MNLHVLFFSALILVAVSGPRLSAGEPEPAQKLYSQYCSSCHGEEGKGDGPVAGHLKIKVPDLTLLRKTHNGRYPLDYMISIIDGRRAVRGHGDREMPVWGEVFREEVAKEKYKELSSLLTAKQIAEYVETLQR